MSAVLADGRTLTEQEHLFARRLGTAVRQTEILQNLEPDIARGRLYAPLDELAAAGVEPADLARVRVDTPAARFLADWRDRLLGALQALPSLLDAPELRRAQRHGLVLASLHVRLLERLGTPRVDVPRRFDPEPLGRLWTAWRTALRHA
jgi:phytoene synthase